MMPTLNGKLLFVLSLMSLALSSANAETPVMKEVVVRDSDSLKAALQGLASGTIIRIGPGSYKGGNSISKVAGITICALDPADPPHFKGGTESWHFTACNGLTLRDLRISGQTGNGINLDDGGMKEPAKDILLERLVISDIGPKGNFDGIKASGLENLTIRDCTIEGWGGQGIDFVGCHKSLITGCKLTGKDGFTASAGVQTKGGCSDVIVENCTFTNASPRPVNVGGSTGAAYFRPLDAKYEARDIIVRDNTITGSDCAAAFVGVDGGEFTSNTILFPTKWVFRILQETTAEGFAPCRNILVGGNKIVLRAADVKTTINIGSHTAAETFRFERNTWFAEDKPTWKPSLPSAEKNGIYGVDPRTVAR